MLLFTGAKHPCLSSPCGRGQECEEKPDNEYACKCKPHHFPVSDRREDKTSDTSQHFASALGASMHEEMVDIPSTGGATVGICRKGCLKQY